MEIVDVRARHRDVDPAHPDRPDHAVLADPFVAGAASFGMFRRELRIVVGRERRRRERLSRHIDGASTRP